MRKVMLVEDEELILQGIRNIIDWESVGMEVVHMAHNGEEALSLWEKEPVDIVVSDINMSIMDGLKLLELIRERDGRVRFILLTGYDEFEYARKAVSLDVEDYILKPVDERKLEKVLKRSDVKLREADRKKEADLDDKAGWLQFLKGRLTREEAAGYAACLPKIAEGKQVYLALLKISVESLHDRKMTDILVELKKEKKLRVLYLASDSLLLLYYNAPEPEEAAVRYFSGIQARLEELYGILTFISLGEPVSDYAALPPSCQTAGKLQKYRMIEGYGGCAAPEAIRSRASEDIVIDQTVLRKFILQKKKEEALGYIEDLFINNIKENASIDDIYQLCLKIAMLLQEIKAEYQLKDKKTMRDLPDMVEKIYHAEDMFGLKTVFIGEIAEIISCLHEDTSQYTPVVRQVMSEAQKNYMEDMNLKTLACKYHMNASYLGQIFQKEVGCSFTQYLNNTKNSIAKDMILNTNMRINDIAKAVGYPDTSYFYRKFKQCYGVSPASLREMKKY